MLNREYMPKWKIDLEEALEKNEKEVTEKVTVKVTSATEIDMLKLMKENGIPEKQIRAIAMQKKISMKTVDEILGSNETKKVVHA